MFVDLILLYNFLKTPYVDLRNCTNFIKNTNAFFIPLYTFIKYQFGDFMKVLYFIKKHLILKGK